MSHPLDMIILTVFEHEKKIMKLLIMLNFPASGYLSFRSEHSSEFPVLEHSLISSLKMGDRVSHNTKFSSS